MNRSLPFAGRSLAAAGTALVVLAACATRPAAEPLADEPALDAFARSLERDLEAHDWQSILSRAEESHHRTQVIEHGMPEPQYVAELFGLHRVDNSISREGTMRWSDLERIAEVQLEALTRAGSRYTVRGVVTLRDGSVLDLEARIDQSEGRYVLTGGVG